MSFIEQTAKLFSNIAEIKFQAVLFGRDALYIEGARPIKIDSDEMLFRVVGAVISVVGSGMSVKEMDGDCTAVVGKISSFSVRDL